MAKAAKKSESSETTGDTTGSERLRFQAEVSRLLNIVANSLYSEKEIFLRELISNASDACDRLRYAALTEPGLAEGDGGFAIRLVADRTARTLSIVDNGIGMNREELIENLGTIARSGTAAFLDGLASDKKAGKGEVNLIGQFGVGFYSAFMVADSVVVVTRKAGEKEGWRWTSDGQGEFTVEPAPDAARGAAITLHLKEDADEYLEPARLRNIVKTYSDHISFLITLDAKGGEKKDEVEDERLNQASAIWARPKSEVDEKTYTEFYHHVAHALDDPWLTLHFKAEGVIEYAGLLYVPTTAPFDLFHPERKSCVKLYVRRVFITDDCETLVPSWLRFLRGVVDSEDLPLNVSRELLQNSPILSKIRAGVTSRVIGALLEKAEKEPDAYAGFWNAFGPVLKEGLYEDFEHREKLTKLVRFRSTQGDDLVSLADYAGRMKKGQDAIYYITGDSLDAVRRSPQLEGFQAKGVEVLLLTDPIDEFWVPSVGVYEKHPFKSVTRGGADLGKIEAEAADEKKPDEPKTEGIDALIAMVKLELGDAVKDVRSSDRLTDSAVCLVADDGDLDMHLQRMLAQHKQLDRITPRVLEINPKHALIRSLAARARTNGAGADLKDAAHLLLDQARIMEGEALPDPADYARRMTAVMAAAYGQG